jgi:hypothetical protein
LDGDDTGWSHLDPAPMDGPIRKSFLSLRLPSRDHTWHSVFEIELKPRLRSARCLAPSA